MPKIYSPSQTIKFLECPAEWWMYKQGWRKRWMSKGTLAAILGSAFHTAIGENYRLQRGGHADDLVAVARASIKKELKTYHELGFQVGTRDLDLEAALPAKAEALVRYFLNNDPVPTEWEYGEPELTLPDFGYCRIDLPVKSYSGSAFVPLDFKVKLRMEPRYEWKTKQEWEFSWQFMHYAAGLAAHYKTNVEWFYVVWCSLEPKPKAELLDYYVDPELMQLWLNSAKSAWHVMESIENDVIYPYHTFKWFGSWGKTDFAEAFMDFKLHDDLMHDDYINIGDRRL